MKKKIEPCLVYSPLTNTIYIEVGKEKYPVSEDQLRRLLDIVERVEGK